MIVKFKENRVRRAYTGGARIDRFVGKENPKDSRYPEDWLASTVEAFNPDMPKAGEGISTTVEGESFRDLLSEKGKELLGERCFLSDGGKMSLLVKLLDSAERLVIQCHPTAEFARERMGAPFGKTECWYILDAEPGAHVYLGFKEGITRKKWESLFHAQDVEGMLACLHKFPVKAGDLWFVEGGVPHAIGGGSFMIELQEPSDLMVIPERITPAGIPLADQKLHGGLGFDGMFDVYSYEGLSEKETKERYFRNPARIPNLPVPIVDASLTDKFSMMRVSVYGKAEVNLSDSYAIAVVTDGSGTLFTEAETVSLRKGESFFAGANTGAMHLEGQMELVFCVSH